MDLEVLTTRLAKLVATPRPAATALDAVRTDALLSGPFEASDVAWSTDPALSLGVSSGSELAFSFGADMDYSPAPAFTR